MEAGLRGGGDVGDARLAAEQDNQARPLTQVGRRSPPAREEQGLDEELGGKDGLVRRSGTGHAG
jgi:hypothetical protein